MHSVSFYATFHNTHGVALRLGSDGTVHFLADDTGLWTQLYDTDAPHLHLHGRCDVASAQALRDGDIFSWIERRNTERAAA